MVSKYLAGGSAARARQKASGKARMEKLTPEQQGGNPPRRPPPARWAKPVTQKKSLRGNQRFQAAEWTR